MLLHKDLSSEYSGTDKLKQHVYVHPIHPKISRYHVLVYNRSNGTPQFHKVV